MKTEVRKWGNSLAVRLPRDLAQSLHLGEGTAIELELIEGALVLRPAVPRRRPGARDLGELLRGVTPDGIHREVDWGERQGGEVW